MCVVPGTVVGFDIYLGAGNYGCVTVCLLIIYANCAPFHLAGYQRLWCGGVAILLIVSVKQDIANTAKV